MMFSSFGSFSLPVSLPRFLRQDHSKAIDIEAVEVSDVELLHDKRSRTLKHLLKLNHANHSIVYHHSQFHNHLPHILGSAYLIGADVDQLNNIYEEESKELEMWQDSPGEVSGYDWREYLGDRRYQRAYVDFFEDELVLNGYDWKVVVNKYLFLGTEPLINCLIAGLGHPLIHLSYAYELSSKELAMEALGLTTTSYNYLHKYLDDPSYTKSSSQSLESPLDILKRVAKDKRFDELFEHQGDGNIEKLFNDHEELVLEYWNAWQITNPRKQFEESQYTAGALLSATSQHGSSSYDFFFVHTLTTSHALRVLLPFMPASFHVSLVRQWWLFALAVYIAQLRTPIELESVIRYDLDGKDWTWVDEQAIRSRWATDAHYVKALRALKAASSTWSDEHQFYLKAACKFAGGFPGWGGFGPLGAERVY